LGTFFINHIIMKQTIVVFFAAVLSFSACTKAPNCPAVLNLSVNNATTTIGGDFKITAPKESDNTTFQWYGPGINSTTNSNTLEKFNVKYSDRGWYYCSKANSECNTSLQDSIFVDVKLNQETPPCTLTNNYISCSNIPNVSLTSITQGFDPTFNGMAVYGSGSFGYPSFRVLFNSYNGNTEPIDGTYTTTNSLTFDITQQYNEVSVSFLYSSIFFHCHPYQKLYVTHVNGKIQVSFCNMVFSSGSSTLTTCSGKMTKQ
jgi:hypothetical protein